MTSTSSEPLQQVVLRDLPSTAVGTADTARDLREGEWTRFGSTSVLGDQATEDTLRGLAERSRAAARAQGFAAGWAEGQRAHAARAAAAHDEQERVVSERSAHLLLAQHSAVSALEAAVRRCADSTRDLHAELSDKAVDLALELAEAILGRELETAADPGADALRRALATVQVETPVVVRLNPQDVAALDHSLLADRPVTVVPDQATSRGDALVETEAGVIDAGIATAVARVREVLGR
jgi:flagellar assembly protein FliH